jgi:TonB family protein
MRARHLAVLLSLFWVGAAPGKTQSQVASAEVRSDEGHSGEKRRIVRQTPPSYPPLAKRMNLSGTVRVLATVGPDGTVKTVQPVGGSPVLIQAAQDAVYKWKFATAGSESKESVEIHFNSQ